MKIKQDFITNSSSMNFIIKGATIGEILKEISKIHNHDWKSYFPSNRNKDHEGSIKTFEFLFDNKNFNENVIFPWTCNYETFIFRISKDQIRVETCNNVDWFGKGFLRKFKIKVLRDDYDYKSDKEIFLDLSDMKTKTGKKFREDSYAKIREELEQSKKEREEKKKNEEMLLMQQGKI